MPASRFEPDRRRAGLPLAVLATLAAAASFHVAQNRLALTGGGIAWMKSLWLGLAIAFWLVVPAFIATDRRFAPALRRPFRWLLWLMAARCLVEGWLLYVSHGWSPCYGIGHDLACALALLAGAALAGGDAGARADPWRPTLRRHALISAALFGPEIGYAAYLAAHFRTAGAAPVYFVPDDGAHAMLLGVTAAVDALALACLAWFVRTWLHGTPDRPRP